MTTPELHPGEHPGERDRRAAETALAERLPGALMPLATVAYNYRWSWVHGGAEVNSLPTRRRALAEGQQRLRQLIRLRSRLLDQLHRLLRRMLRCHQLSGLLRMPPPHRPYVAEIVGHPGRQLPDGLHLLRLMKLLLQGRPIAIGAHPLDQFGRPSKGDLFDFHP